MSPTRLDDLRDALAERGTRSFLVIRNGRLVYEWYSMDHGPNLRHAAAASTKALVGGLVLAVAADDGRIRLSDPAAQYIPEWREDRVRSKITIRQLASHRSGLQDVNFDLDRPDIPAWEGQYVEDADSRYAFALDRADIIFTPGSRYSYSGVGYYVISYAVTVALQGTSPDDLEALYRERIARPMGIPDSAWRMSYGESYKWQGMTLYACGSGGSFTARAAARIGQLMINDGEWEGQQLVSAAQMRELVREPRSGPAAGSGSDATSHELVPGLGWILNTRRLATSLPADAIFAIGRNAQIVVVIPSLALVVVRNGQSPYRGTVTDRWQELDRILFRPIMESVVAPAQDQDPE
ncbi:MAG: serine hydrolase domain-containing protein [Acidobacteriota bacterium]